MGLKVMLEQKKVAIIGGGGHAAVLADVLRLVGHHVLGCTAPTERDVRVELPWLGTDGDFIANGDSAGVWMVNGIGMIRSGELRESLFHRYESAGYRFLTIVHPSATVSGSALLEAGSQVMAGAIVQAYAVVGSNSIINTRASVDHHTKIGSHVHVAPGATICGDVQVGESAFIGAGATIIHGIRIGQAVTVGAGAVVIKNVSDNQSVIGIPAKEKSS